MTTEMLESTAELVSPMQFGDPREQRARPSTGGQATVGSRIEFIDLEHDVTLEYQVVRPIEGDPANGKLSVASPLGRALLGRRGGDIVEVESDARGRHLIVVCAVSPGENVITDAWPQRAG